MDDSASDVLSEFHRLIDHWFQWKNRVDVEQLFYDRASWEGHERYHAEKRLLNAVNGGVDIAA